MIPLSDKERLITMINIASLAIAAEKASLDRRHAQSDFNTVHSETGKKPSRKKLDRLESFERNQHAALRKAIYEYADRIDAEAARLAGTTAITQSARGYNAQLLADHLP